LITASKLSDLLQHPAGIHGYDNAAVEKWVKEYPFFSLFQYIRSLKTDPSADLAALRELYPAHPVLLYLLKQNSSSSYHYKDVNIPETAAADTREAAAKFDNPVDEILFSGSHTPDYFPPAEVSEDIPEDIPTVLHAADPEQATAEDEEQMALMRVMSFSEWLSFLSHKNKKEKAEEESRRHLKAMWQKEKLAKAMEDETDEIPETVFNMAVNSLNAPEDIMNESMAEVYVRQHKYTKAIEIYQKLSLLYPEKSTYFASKIEKIKKEI